MLVGSWHNIERFWERKFLQVHEQSILPPLWEIIFENISCYRPFQKTWKETLCVPLNQIKVSFSWEKKWGKFFFLPFKKKKTLCKSNVPCIRNTCWRLLKGSLTTSSREREEPGEQSCLFCSPRPPSQRLWLRYDTLNRRQRGMSKQLW